MRKNYFTLFFWILLFFSFSFLCYFMYTKIDWLLDSDMSSEMILSNLIAQENGILSSNWFYSTELRVINTQLFFGFFFHFFNDWHLVRVLGSIFLYILLLSVCFLFCREFKQKKYFPLIAIFLIIPFSTSYFYSTIVGAFYIPHIVFGFAILALVMHILNSNKKVYLFYIILFIVSMMAGLNGLRQIVTLFIPLFVSSCILIFVTYFYKAKFKSLVKYVKTLFTKHCGDVEFKYFIVSIVALFGALIGYLINNNILSKIYTYEMWENITFKNFDIVNFFKVLFGFVNVLGYEESKITIFSLISNFTSILLFVLVILSAVYAIKNKNKVSNGYYILSLFVASAFSTFVLLYSFTNLQYVTRYNVPIIVYFIPLIIFYFKYSDWNLIYKKMIAVVLSVLLLISAGYNYRHYYFSNYQTYEFKNIVNVLLKNKTYNGYTGFWSANVLTELSNGKIDVWDWADCQLGTVNLSGVHNIDSTYRWLQKKKHVDTHPTGKVFVLLGKDRVDDNDYFDNFNGKDNVAFSSDNYILYIFEDYNTLVDYVGN